MIFAFATVSYMLHAKAMIAWKGAIVKAQIVNVRASKLRDTFC